MVNFKTGVGTNIKIFRKLANLTQEQLAEMIEIDSRQLSKIENGIHFPSCKTLEKICIALNLKPAELFDFEFNANDEISLTQNVKVSKHSVDKETEKNLLFILDEFKKISHNPYCIEFIKCSFAAIKNKKELQKLENMITGLKLSGK